MQTTFEPEFRALARGTSHRLTFSAHLFAPEVQGDESARSLVSLTSVLDRSGSMGGSKLDLVKRTSDFMMQHLSSQDKLGVVIYDSDVQELLQLARTSEAFKAEAKRVVRSINAGSCTNLSGGLFQGVKQQQDNTYIDWDDGAPPADQPPAPPGEGGGGGSPTSSTAQSHFSNAESFVMVPVEEPEEDNDDDDDEEEELQQQFVQANEAPIFQIQTVGPPRQERGVVVDVQTQNIAPIDPRSYPMQDIASRINAIPNPAFAQQQQQLRGFDVPAAVPVQQQQVFTAPVRRRRQGTRNVCLTRELTREAVEKAFGGRAPPAGKPVEDGAVRSVFLFTDGLANEGVTETGRLVAMLRKALDKSPRVRVFTFGFGEDHSPQMLKALAEAGSGTYYYIETEDRIPTAFADALGGLLSVAVQNVQVDFLPAPGVTVSRAHTGFSTEPLAGGGGSVRVGDVFGGESKDLLFDVDVPALPSPADAFPVGTLRVSYLDVAGAVLRREEVPCTVARPEVAVGADAEPSARVTLQRARVETARALLEAQAEADRGRFESARARIGGSLGWLRGVAARTGGGEGGEMARNFVEDLEEALGNMAEPATYCSHGTKVMSGKAMAHMQQRSAALEEDGFDDEDEGEGQGAAAGAAQGPRKSKFSYANKTQRVMRKSAKTWFST
uniref:VWFA domain-containing protein n=1 Tax=Hemiselmis tepida TaxID=464990 RepID=A0A7S0WEN2_9CRYP|mmetsp:Transcript_4088/g.10402  ORF Transcript_4088/g.10402 Transcript_4088/m.10402 type:complete len:669 (+) Transcript_4088:93-2099(+)